MQDIQDGWEKVSKARKEIVNDCVIAVYCHLLRPLRHLLSPDNPRSSLLLLLLLPFLVLSVLLQLLQLHSLLLLHLFISSSLPLHIIFTGSSLLVSRERESVCVLRGYHRCFFHLPSLLQCSCCCCSPCNSCLAWFCGVVHHQPH